MATTNQERGTRNSEKATVMATEIDYTPKIRWEKRHSEVSITLDIGNKSYNEKMVDPSPIWYAAFFKRAGENLLMG